MKDRLEEVAEWALAMVNEQGADKTPWELAPYINLAHAAQSVLISIHEQEEHDKPMRRREAFELIGAGANEP